MLSIWKIVQWNCSTEIHFWKCLIRRFKFIFKVRRNYEFTAWYKLDEELVRQFRVLNIISENGKFYLIGIRRIQLWHDETELRRNADVKHNLNMARKAGGFWHVSFHWFYGIPYLIYKYIIGLKNLFQCTRIYFTHIKHSTLKQSGLTAGPGMFFPVFCGR